MLLRIYIYIHWLVSMCWLIPMIYYKSSTKVWRLLFCLHNMQSCALNKVNNLEPPHKHPSVFFSWAVHSKCSSLDCIRTGNFGNVLQSCWPHALSNTLAIFHHVVSWIFNLMDNSGVIEFLFISAKYVVFFPTAASCSNIQATKQIQSTNLKIYFSFIYFLNTDFHNNNHQRCRICPNNHTQLLLFLQFFS